MGDLPEELRLLPFGDSKIDRLYIRGVGAGRGFSIGNENQTPLEAADAAGWRYIRTFDSRISSEQGAVGVNAEREVIAVVDYADGPWAVNITAEMELEVEDLLRQEDSPPLQP